MTSQNVETPNPLRWRALTVCLIAGFMTMLDVSIVNVALPSMQTGLHAPATDLSWVVSGYALTFGLALVPAGKLGDDFGRKRMFQIGLAMFVVTSALCGFAPSSIWLVIGRLLQGVAGGLLNPQVIGVIQEMFRGKERGRAFGLFGTIIGVSTAVGPMVGGLLLQWAGTATGWRWVFYVNLPIGIVALIAGAMWLPSHVRSDKPARRLDLLGSLLLGLGVVGVMLPLIEAEQSAADAPWYLLAVGAVLLVAFVGWERSFRRRGGHTLVNLELLRQRSYAMGTTLGMCYFAGFTGIFLALTLFLQQGLGYSPLLTGLTMLPFAVGGAVSSLLAGRVVLRFGRPMIVIGMVAVALGLAGSALIIEFGHSYIGLLIAGPQLLAGIGSGMVISPNQTLALEDVPPAEGGTAAGVLQTGQRIGSAIGTAVAGYLFFSTLAPRHDYHAATSTGLFGSVALVCLALIVGIFDIVLGRKHRKPAQAVTTTLTIDGTVLEKGEPPNANITITVTTEHGQQIAVTRPDTAGGYHVIVPESGRYLVTVATPEHNPQVSAVDVDTVATGVDFCFACTYARTST